MPILDLQEAKEINRQHMPDEAAILRPSPPSQDYPTDDTTGPPPPEQGDSIPVVESGIPCRVTTSSASEQFAQGAQQAVRRHFVHLDGDRDVRESDVLEVTHGDGGANETIRYEVEGVDEEGSIDIQTTCECIKQ